MNKNHISRLTTLLIICFVSVNLFAAPKPKKELYIPMDYSTCGYHASEKAIPTIPVSIFVAWQDGDCADRIQQAIDEVARQRPDANGYRGCVLLGEGVFKISKAIRITTSGIVLRGVDKHKTVIQKTGADRGAAIYIEGKRSTTEGDPIAVTDEKVAAGSTHLTLKSVKGLQVGSRINILRPSTTEWIASLNMNDFGGGLDYTGWKATDIDITWDRIITAVNGTTITIDAPITTTLSQKYGGATVIKTHHDGELTECGVENLTIDSEHATWNAKDEDHCWDGIFMNHVRDTWVRKVIFLHLAGSAVNLQKQTSRITIEDCIAQQPVSEIGGWRRQVFLTRGQQTLFQRCISRQGIHDFAAGYCAAGPNAFVQCEGEESLGFSGSIGSWAAGLLFDIVNIDGSDIRFANLEQFQFGTGWNTANSMLWQCTASTIECYSPDKDNRCSGHGCWGTLTGNGEWTSSNDHVIPRSLFYDQLEKRLGKLPFEPYILPRPTNASSSPTVEQAMKMANESQTQPRLTLEMWQDSIPTLGDGSAPHSRHALTDHQKHPQHAPTTKAYSIINGHLAVDGMLLTGNQYAIPWWSGRVKDNFVEHGAKPAITRFVPGREGLGWTDRIDSVVNYLSDQHYSLLYHNYGLWYDLRRTDHERIRRADGDVWAPFYEQPFSRSGEGTAWDGLSRYDLSKPNRWYWGRLNEFAQKAAQQNILLFNEHYFQHNILEAGAHWVDCPWRPVNNINGTDFPEPVPFAGDKRIFMAEQFYNEQNPILQPLHRQYIRMCLDQTKDQPNVIHSISAEYTGPLHFTRFWLKTVAEWEAETGCHPLIALSCTKDVQDSILADPELRKVVDIIDIRYWHYNTQGLWAPEGGRNMAPRQWMRKFKVGKTGFEEAYKSVMEYRTRYPEKAVTFFSQQYPTYGWAILLAGGSLPNIPLTSHLSKATGRRAELGNALNSQLLQDVCQMKVVDAEGCLAIGDPRKGYLVYTKTQEGSLPVTSGKYHIYAIDMKTGDITLQQKGVRLQNTFRPDSDKGNQLYWLRSIQK